MTLYTQLQTANDCYKTGQWITPKGIVVHSTGCNNPYLRRYCAGPVDVIGVNRHGNHWDRPGTNAAVHAFIGRDAHGGVATIQCLPWSMRGWHVGRGRKGSYNNTHISFELCEDDLQDGKYFSAVYREAVELCAYLCEMYGLDPMHDICDHHEAHMRGYASNHGDVSNWFPRHGKNMDRFRADVYADMHKEEDDMTYYKTLADVPTYYKDAVKAAMDKGGLLGTGDGINISEDLARTLTILYRMGKL